MSKLRIAVVGAGLTGQSHSARLQVSAYYGLQNTGCKTRLRNLRLTEASAQAAVSG